MHWSLLLDGVCCLPVRWRKDLKQVRTGGWLGCLRCRTIWWGKTSAGHGNGQTWWEGPRGTPEKRQFKPIVILILSGYLIHTFMGNGWNLEKELIEQRDLLGSIWRLRRWERWPWGSWGWAGSACRRPLSEPSPCPGGWPTSGRGQSQHPRTRFLGQCSPVTKGESKKWIWGSEHFSKTSKGSVTLDLKCVLFFCTRS